MSRSTAPARSPARSASRGLGLRVVAAAALALSAYVHWDLARGPLVAGGHVTVAGLFTAQAVVAIVVAVVVLLRPGRAAWTAVAVVGLASLAALVLSVYVQIPAVGPLPTLYEPLWYGEKVLAVAAAAVAAVAALVALTGRRR
ncbi:MAG: hypothetical protein JWR62_1380 [Modestobacter sp.]|jgi:hypothetical protein|nr:hypothetical protein [Modestobacter sp.]